MLNAGHALCKEQIADDVRRVDLHSQGVDVDLDDVQVSIEGRVRRCQLLTPGVRGVEQRC